MFFIRESYLETHTRALVTKNDIKEYVYLLFVSHGKH